LLVQLPEKTDRQDYPTISTICRERITRAGRKFRDDAATLDVGFRCFKLTESNFKPWDGDTSTLSSDSQLSLSERLDAHANHVADMAQTDDILFELLLKDGFPLAVPIVKLSLAGNDVFSIADGALLVCLAKRLTQEVIDAMADMEPSRVVCLDAGFQGNDQLKANAVQTFKARARNRETAIEFRTV
jgi:adenine-specific DNA-methyltransferase